MLEDYSKTPLLDSQDRLLFELLQHLFQKSLKQQKNGPVLCRLLYHRLYTYKEE